VLSGAKIKLNEWPTKVKPFYKSKKQYHKLLEEHIDQLRTQQRIEVHPQQARKRNRGISVIAGHSLVLLGGVDTIQRCVENCSDKLNSITHSEDMLKHSP